MERANEQWSVFLTSSKLAIERKLAGMLPWDSGDYLFLKATPEIPDLTNKIFGDWSLADLGGVFLQKWNHTRNINCDLIFIDISSLLILELKTNIPTKHWSTQKVNEDELLFSFSLNSETVTYKVRREDLSNDASLSAR